MAKLTRKTQKIFAKDGSIGRFGSAATGTPVVSTAGDLSDMQSLAAYTNGWADAVLNGKKRPPLEEFNTLNYINNYQLSYLFQEGIAEYDAGTNYFIDSLVKSSGLVYKSLVDDNLGASLSNTANWQVMGDLKTSVNIVFVDRKGDLPAAVANVITLEAKTYIITTEVDLSGDRIVAIEGSNIIGVDANISKLISTGLTGNALITSNYGINIKFITIEAETPFNLDASANAGQALDWLEVNLVNCTNAGVIKTYDNFIGQTIAVLDSAGFSFDGTIGTIAFANTLFNTSSGKTAINLAATLAVSRRVRIQDSSFVNLSGETGIKLNSGATIPDEGLIINFCNFSGGGTYLDGIASEDDEARFVENRGIANSLTAAQYYMNNNATATTIAVAGTYYKVLGTTLAGSLVQRFNVATSNRAIYTGALTSQFKVTVSLSFTGTNGNDIRFRIAKNGTTIASTQISRTVNGTGNYASLSLQDIVQLSTNDYIEVFATNSGATNSITVSDLNVIITR